MRGFRLSQKHKRKKPFKTQGYKRMCKTKQIEEKGQIVGANARGSYYLYYLLRFFPNFFSFDTFCILVFFICFSDYGRVLCTNKRLYVRLSRTWFS